MAFLLNLTSCLPPPPPGFCWSRSVDRRCDPRWQRALSGKNKSSPATRLHSVRDPHKWQLSSRENEQDNAPMVRATKHRYKAASFKHKLLLLCYPFPLYVLFFFFLPLLSSYSRAFLDTHRDIQDVDGKIGEAFLFRRATKKLTGPLLFWSFVTDCESSLPPKSRLNMKRRDAKKRNVRCTLIIVLTSGQAADKSSSWSEFRSARATG